VVKPLDCWPVAKRRVCLYKLDLVIVEVEEECTERSRYFRDRYRHQAPATPFGASMVISCNNYHE
jgi:hypothetical protein